jgi:hypothetical protein
MTFQSAPEIVRFPTLVFFKPVARFRWAIAVYECQIFVVFRRSALLWIAIPTLFLIPDYFPFETSFLVRWIGFFHG